VAQPEGLYWTRAEEALLLRYYANSIAHLLAAPPIAQAAE
jgi:glycerol-3-phosphate O-acyltransferase